MTVKPVIKDYLNSLTVRVEKALDDNLIGLYVSGSLGLNKKALLNKEQSLFVNTDKVLSDKGVRCRNVADSAELHAGKSLRRALQIPGVISVNGNIRPAVAVEIRRCR